MNISLNLEKWIRLIFQSGCKKQRLESVDNWEIKRQHTNMDKGSNKKDTYIV